MGTACQHQKQMLDCCFGEFGGDTLLSFVVVAGDTCVSPRTHADVDSHLSAQFPAKVSIFIQYPWPNHQYPSILECFQVVLGDFGRFIDA